jgi:uncharacterized protein YndB with AHSA1/START domain
MTTDTAGSKFVYVTYIRTSADKLWHAIQDPEFIRQYWFGMTVDCEWTKGAAWTLSFADGRVADRGEVVEIDPPKRLVLRWRNEFKPELVPEGDSRCLFELEPKGDAMKLTVTHTIEIANSKLIVAVSGGWPKVLSNLKSLLETGSIVVS